MKNSLRSAAVAAAMLGAIFGIGCSAQADQTTDKLKSTLQERMGDATIKSVEKSPDNASYHYHLALALSKAGSAQRARQAAEQAIKLKPDYAEAQKLLAQVKG